MSDDGFLRCSRCGNNEYILNCPTPSDHIDTVNLENLQKIEQRWMHAERERERLEVENKNLVNRLAESDKLIAELKEGIITMQKMAIDGLDL